MSITHKSKAALAKALGFSAPAITKWESTWDNCPRGSLNVTEWRNWIASHGAGFYRDRPADNREAERHFLRLIEGNVDDLQLYVEDRCPQTGALLEKWADKFAAVMKEAEQLLEAS